jgi:hypothetical protein
MGVTAEEINDNWQPIGSLVGRIVADVIRRMDEREAKP